MLFRVPHETTDVTRVSGMVQKRRLIYRMTSFGYRKVFGHYRDCTGSYEWVPDVHQEGANPPGGRPKALGVEHQPLVGWWDSPRGPMRQRKKTKEKEKNEVGRKRRTPLSNPNWSRIGVGLLLSLGRRTLEGLTLKTSLLPIPPIYSGDLGLI